jgi:hypothetical protein
MTKLYLLRRKVEKTGYDEVLGFVVAAATPSEARKIVATPGPDHAYGNEGPSTWLSPACSTVRCLGRAAPSLKVGVISRDFNAG